MKTNNQFKSSILHRIMVTSIILLLSMPLIMNGQNWKTNGNAAVPADFLGTNNAQDLRIRTNGTQKAVVTTSGNVGIGTSTPAARLDVIGKIKITDGSQGAGKVLVSDANGLGTWQIISTPPSGWGLTGNSGTIDGTNFIGTTDDVPLNIRVNNQKSGRIDRVQFNTFYGYQSGESNTSGVYNTANGMAALQSNTVGTYATAIGAYALRANTTGIHNTGCGSFALSSNDVGQQNTATGYAALSFNTNGSFNTANGANSLSTNTTGYYNTAIGGNALYSNTIGYDNTATGMQALRNNISGNYNTAHGKDALFNTVTGSHNTAGGVSALESNTTGQNNSAFGLGALYTNISGSNNTAIGYGADVGSDNLTNATAIGANTIAYLSNTMILGNNVNVGIGVNNPFHKLDVRGETQQVGMFTNTAVASDFVGVAGQCNATPWYGTGVVGIGGAVGVHGAADMAGSGDRVALFGNARYGTGANHGVLAYGYGGGTSYGVKAYAYGDLSTTQTIGIFGYALADSGSVWAGYFAGDVHANGVFTSSDRKLKSDIKPLSDAMSIISRLKPSVYKFRTDEFQQMQLPEGLQYGLIADEVQKVLPDAVKKAVQPAEYENHDSKNGKMLSDKVEFNTVNYTQMIPILIAGMKEQQSMIESLSEEVKALQEKIQSLMNGTETGSSDRQGQSIDLTEMNSAFLGQNTPNPFDQASSITCYLPEGSANGHILIYSSTGVLVKDFKLSNQGLNHVTIDAGSLISGIYTYSLIINGKVFDTKRMTVTK